MGVQCDGLERRYKMWDCNSRAGSFLGSDRLVFGVRIFGLWEQTVEADRLVSRVRPFGRWGQNIWSLGQTVGSDRLVSGVRPFGLWVKTGWSLWSDRSNKERLSRQAT